MSLIGLFLYFYQLLFVIFCFVFVCLFVVFFSLLLLFLLFLFILLFTCCCWFGFVCFVFTRSLSSSSSILRGGH